VAHTDPMAGANAHAQATVDHASARAVPWPAKDARTPATTAAGATTRSAVSAIG